MAEHIVFGSITTGASDDLTKVAEITRAMVHEYAMGTGLQSSQMSTHGDELSDSTRRMRDQEQRDLADEAFREAFRLIEGNRDKLEELATTLLRDEVLERSQIDRIMGEALPAPPSSAPPVAAPDLRVAATSHPPLDRKRRD